MHVNWIVGKMSDPAREKAPSEELENVERVERRLMARFASLHASALCVCEFDDASDFSSCFRKDTPVWNTERSDLSVM